MSTLMPRLLAPLRPLTLERLAPLGLTPADLPAHLAQASGAGRPTLCAERWQIGQAECLCELRLVTIQGQASEIHNAWVFPVQPAALPVFASEILVFGHRPRLAFIDVPAPGLCPALLPQLAHRLAAISERYQDLRPGEPPPDWATNASTGHWLYARSTSQEMLPRLLQAYQEYLTAWIDFATSGGEADPGPTVESESTPDSVDRYTQYKQHHAAHTPGRTFLAKLYGPDWAEQFMDQFLYH